MKLIPYPREISLVLTFGTLATAALVAQGAISLIATAWRPREVPAFDFGGARAAPPPGSEPPDACAILARNVFDSSTGALCPPRKVAAPAPPWPTPCDDGSRRLVAAVHSARTPERSFAAVAMGPGTSLLLRQGERIGDDELFAVFPRAVLFKQPTGHYCSLTFAGDAAAARTASTRMSPVTPAEPRRLDDIESGITAVTTTEFRVQRATVDAMLMNQETLARPLRIIPHEEDGRVVGVRVFGIRGTSPWRKLGLQNGDLLRAIDGRELASADAALEVYGRLRSTHGLSVALERRGQPMTLSYVIE